MNAERHDGRWIYYARCDATHPDHCGAIMPPQIEKSEDRVAVAAAWNRRTPPVPASPEVTPEMLWAGREEIVERLSMWPGEGDIAAIYSAMRSKERP